MAIESGFFTSSGGDRRYKADAFAEYFSSFVGNGILPSPSTMLQTVEASGMTVNVLAGKAFVNGHYLFNTEPYPLTLATADGVYSRIDRIVVRLDLAYRSVTIAVKTGIAAPKPTAPEVTRDDTVYELSLATISVAAGSTSVSQTVITDTRQDSAVCGFSTMLPKALDATGLFAQYNAEWQNFKDMYVNDEGLGAAVLHFNEVADQINDGFDIIKNTSMHTAAGTATALTVSIPLVTEYKPGAMYWVLPTATNNAAVTTIKINSLEALPLYKIGTTTVPNLKANVPFLVFISSDAKKAYFVKTGGASVKVQRGTTVFSQTQESTQSLYQDIPISNIDITKSFINVTSTGYSIMSYSGGGSAPSIFNIPNVSGRLINSTMARVELRNYANYYGSSSAGYRTQNDVTVSWEVITFED